MNNRQYNRQTMDYMETVLRAFQRIPTMDFVKHDEVVSVHVISAMSVWRGDQQAAALVGVGRAAQLWFNRYDATRELRGH
jgi:hypothetical protein